jgi:2-polyprenyl-3-methyl-5-hydroxy-6-metoxy-1,4-benzoquinol methylase
MTTNRPALALLDPRGEAAPAVAWEEVPCPLCGADSGAPFLEAADPLPASGTGLVFAVVRCDHCGLAYTNPRPTEQAISRFYPDDYRPHRAARRPRAHRRVNRLVGRLLGRPCEERRGALPWPGAGRLLDFGCGGGSFLRTMAERGWQVTGLDASAAAVEQIREQFGLPALVGTLPHPDLRPGSFDVVTMWHSLEHVHAPLAVLREAYRLLVPGGKLIVATPNVASLPFRIFGPAWFGLDLPRHLTHFAPHTLRAVLHSAGFRAGRVRQLRHSEWLRASARLALRQGTGGLLSRALTWKPLSKAAAWMCYAAGQSDCILCVAERPA